MVSTGDSATSGHYRNPLSAKASCACSHRRACVIEDALTALLFRLVRTSTTLWRPSGRLRFPTCELFRRTRLQWLRHTDRVRAGHAFFQTLLELAFLWGFILGRELRQAN